MKIILVSGAYSGCGKTKTVDFLAETLNGVFCLKLGEGKNDPDKKHMLVDKHVSYGELMKYVPSGTEYLIVESNNRDLFEGNIGLHIFVDGEPGKYKQNALETKSKADLVSGTSVECASALLKSRILNINPKVFGSLLDELNIKVRKCQLGLFDK